MRILIPSITVCLLLLGCNAQDLPATGTTTPRPAETAQVIPSQTKPVTPAQGDTLQKPTHSSPPAASGMQDLIAKAMEDLAQRLLISDSQIMLVEAQEVVWPDSSLGCPQPGMAYLQVPEDGARIIFEVDGSKYSYHTGGSLGLFLCEMVYKDPYSPSQIDITTLTPVTPAKNNPTPPLPDNSIPPGGDQ